MINFAAMIRSLFVLLLLSTCVQTFAQKGKTKKEPKEKVPVYNYVIDDPMDAFGRQPVPPDVVTTILVPAFYSPLETRNGDTTQKYECYDAANNIMKPDTIHDYSLIRYVSLIQRYTDPLHTYKDANGKLQPLPTEKIIYRYDKTGKDKWFSVNYATNKSEILQEFPNEITRADTTTIINPTTGVALITVYKYYRVSSLKN